MSSSLSAIILTFNEEKHIERCLESVRGIAAEVFVVDSHSNDNTAEIASRAGATILHNRWVNYSAQFNWALDNAPLRTDWCLRIDADEILSQQLQCSILAELPGNTANAEITGFYLTRMIKFAGKPIRWGGVYPVRQLRIFRRGVGRCEERWMDEHIVLAHGRALRLKGDLVDNNLNNIGWWTAKHNSYATREAIDLLNNRRRFIRSIPKHALNVRTAEGRRRYVKEAIYSRFPIGVRALLYFLYRYFVRLGFLDGRNGFLFHVLQGFWYRLLVDAKVVEIEKRSAETGLPLEEVIYAEYGIRLPRGTAS